MRFFLIAAFAAATVYADSSSSASTTYSWTLDNQVTPVFTAPNAFPTKEFDGMYHLPKHQESEPRPIVKDVNRKAFPDSLANSAMPSVAHTTSGKLPKPSAGAEASPSDVRKKLVANFSNKSMSKCDKCRSALRIGQKLARSHPEKAPDMMVDLCKTFQFKQYGKNPDVNRTCEMSFNSGGTGGVFTQVLSYGDFSDDGKDADYICSQFFFGMCEIQKPATLSDDFLNEWFHGQREEPDHVTQRCKKVGPKADKNLNVLWTSDVHLDPRYVVGSEASCTYKYCCHIDSYNTTVYNVTGYRYERVPSMNLSIPAPYWGYEGCDAPWSLAASAFQAVENIAPKGGYDLSLYTGDLVAHGQTWEESADIENYSASAIYNMLRRHTNNTPTFPTLGNHDTYPTEFNAPDSLPDGRGNQFSWDYNYVAKLWNKEGWLNHTTVKEARTHYGGFSVSPRKGLRIVSFNADFWYTGNGFAFINTTNPDIGGVLRWVTDELQAAEDAHERVWVMAHVLPGWDGYSTLDRPTNLFYQIVSRYRSTIAHMFFGHSHEDEFSVFYHNTNGNSSSASRLTKDAVNVMHVSPSVTPLTNMNPGIRVLEIDPETYEMMDYHQYYTPLQNVQNVTETKHGLVWYRLYSARETYSNFSASEKTGNYSAPVQLENGKWPASAPLNASFWSAVADEVIARPQLATQFNTYQGRNSPLSPPCNTLECAIAKSCYMRSGSFALGHACGGKHSSVQAPA